MRYVEDSKEVGTKSGRVVTWMRIICDTLADIPDPDAYDGITICMGSRAFVIADGSKHVLQSGGQWVQQGASSATYTRSEIDSIVQQINAQNSAQQAEINYIANNGAKNTLENTAPASQIVAGITWAKNADGSMTATGTSTGLSAVRVAGVQGSSSYANAVPIPRGTYIISASGFTVTRYLFVLGFFADDQSTRATRQIYNTEQTLTVESDTARFDFSCVVSVSGETLSGETWYPMIRQAAITDSTYQPYAPTNRKLYELIKQYHP